MELQTIHKRLYWSALALAAYVILLLAIQLATTKKSSELASYSAAVSTLPGRFHEPMSRYELATVAQALRALQAGGDLGVFGLPYSAPSLATVLGEDRFDMDATLALLDDGRIRPALAKVELLATKVQRVNERRGRILAYLQWLSLAGVFLIVLFISNAWWRSRTSLTDNISAAEEPEEDESAQTFNDYLQKVLEEEVAFTGFAAKLNCKGFDEVILPSDLLSPIETAAEQLVRNSIEHGGRALEDRLMAGKSEHLNIDVHLTEHDNHYELVVRDDGEGIDETEVVLRAIKLELLSAENAREIPPGQGIKYIFLPGYSGEKQAFGVSQNSISLDKLRRMIKLHGGTIGLQNLPGKYCQFTIKFAKPKDQP